MKAMLDLCQSFGWTYVSFVYSEGSYGQNAATYADHFLRDADNGYTICLATTVKIPSDADQAEVDDVIRTLNTVCV